MKSLIGSSRGQEGRDYATGNHNFRLEPHLESTFDKNGVTTVKTLKVLSLWVPIWLMWFLFSIALGKMKLYYIDKTQKNLRHRIAQKVISYLRIIKKIIDFWQNFISNAKLQCYLRLFYSEKDDRLCKHKQNPLNCYSCTMGKVGNIILSFKLMLRWEYSVVVCIRLNRYSQENAQTRFFWKNWKS